ncbi:hypothetical protein I4U23_002270 [Adineta vaga]|nr:hypothetical protein I4U23_002270 [Adineta vaga]
MTTTTASSSIRNKIDNTLNIEHFTDERYPKTCFEQIPPILLEYPPSKQTHQTSRSRHSLRFRTQPVGLAEINETDEETYFENETNDQPTKTKIFNDFHRLDYLILAENIRRTTRKKAPLKNYLERQRLKTPREELCEADGY